MSHNLMTGMSIVCSYRAFLGSKFKFKMVETQTVLACMHACPKTRQALHMIEWDLYRNCQIELQKTPQQASEGSIYAMQLQLPRPAHMNLVPSNSCLLRILP